MTDPVAYPFTGPEYNQIATGTSDIDFWRWVVSSNGGRVLELGIGTGRLAVQLLELCDEYHGIDIEPSMLEVVRAKLEAGASQVALHAGSFIPLRLGLLFDLVLIPANTISHVVSESDAQQFFASVRGHLNEDGRFVVDTFNPRPRPDRGTYEFNRYLDPADQQEVVVLSTPERAGRTVTHHLEHLKDGICFRKTTLVQRLYDRDDLAAALEAAGFSSLEFFGDYSRQPLTADSPRLIVRAT